MYRILAYLNIKANKQLKVYFLTLKVLCIYFIGMLLEFYINADHFFLN